MRDTRVLVEAALMIALTVVLEVIFSNLNLALFANGGSISISVIPFLVFSLRNGWKAGLLVTFVYGVLQAFIPGMPVWYLSPVQYAFDYIFPFIVLPVIAIKVSQSGRELALWSLLVYGLKYTSHVIAGVAFWGEYAPENFNALTWSLYYNATYSVPSAILVALLMFVIFDRYQMILKTEK